MRTINYYVIDSSSLIELNRRYPIDVFPTLWKNIEALIEKRLLISPHEVLNEISAKDDSLKKWAIKQNKFFKELDEEQKRVVIQILKKYPSLGRPDSETAVADPFVIALAVEMGSDPQKTLDPVIKERIIVTEEKLRGNKVKIPLVCNEYDIKCIDIIEMCRVEGWKF